ncbi:MAG: hypothetical protein IT373_00955 [Polyangiaceae bacterium]|nr:hypothetical protein [Polyangiaceae bacterium]
MPDSVPPGPSEAPRAPEPSRSEAGVELGEAVRNEARMLGAWRQWLSSLATDADAVTAAAHLYAELPGDARDAWLDALAEDAPKLDVPGVAIYGPLLAVENNPLRRQRIRRAAGTGIAPMSEVRRALMGAAPGGARIAALVIALYLDFVQVVVCRFVRSVGFEWVRQSPITSFEDAPVAGDHIDGVELFATSAEAVIDELSHAVLAHRRSGRELPQTLRDCAELFSAALPSPAEC